MADYHSKLEKIALEVVTGCLRQKTQSVDFMVLYVPNALRYVPFA